jgi:hypothetical protein
MALIPFKAANGCTKSSTTASAVIARKEGKRVKLYSRPGNDLTDRFPLIVEAMAKLRSQSSNNVGLRIRAQCSDHSVCLGLA